MCNDFRKHLVSYRSLTSWNSRNFFFFSHPYFTPVVCQTKFLPIYLFIGRCLLCKPTVCYLGGVNQPKPLWSLWSDQTGSNQLRWQMSPSNLSISCLGRAVASGKSPILNEIWNIKQRRGEERNLRMNSQKKELENVLKWSSAPDFHGLGC